MNRSGIETLSKEELVDLLLNLHAENVQLRERIAELEAQLQGPPKTPQNSSVPPSAGRKANRRKSAKPRKRGAQPGHKGTSRRRSDPDVTFACRADTCPECGSDVSNAEQHVIGSTQVIEIPPVEPIVVEATRYGCPCPQCGAEATGAYPGGAGARAGLWTAP